MRALAQSFHSLVQQYSKLSREAQQAEKRRSRQSERTASHKNFWQCARSVLDGDGHTSVPPAFTRETAENHFKATYGATAKSFSRPTWMSNVPTPSVPFVKEAITVDKVQQVIQKCKATSIPSPVDQISYRVFKKCPSLLPALLCLFSACWSTSSLPSQWKVGVLRLLGKEAAKTDPGVPSSSGPLP